MTDRYAYCYQLVTEYLSWSQARDKCVTLGGDLVSINSHEEQAFVQEELLTCGLVNQTNECNYICKPEAHIF